MPNASVPAAEIGLPVSLFDDELVQFWRELEHADMIDASDLSRGIRMKIESTPATGFVGLFVKAHTAELVLEGGAPDSTEPGSFLRLIKSILRDLKAIEARATNCPVEKIARVAGEVIEASRRIEDNRPVDREEQEQQLMERLDDFELAATSAPALSPVGAMAQICVASDLLSEIESNGFSARIHRRLRRSLYSIMSVLEGLAGERAEIWRAYYLSPELDPFARPDVEAKELT